MSFLRCLFATLRPQRLALSAAAAAHERAGRRLKEASESISAGQRRREADRDARLDELARRQRAAGMAAE